MGEATPKTSVIPPGGFHYIERHNGVEIKIESHSHHAVAEALLKFRLNNGIAPGNPQQDVNDYVCKNHPHFCTHEDEPYLSSVAPPSREQHLSRRVAQWMVELFKLGSNNETTQARANERAAICAVCPMNKDFVPGACGPCVESTNRLGFIWRRNRSTPDDAKLFGCTVIGQLNPAAVQAGTLPPLQPDDNALLPTACWRKQ